jgi:hypothetical protein
MLIGHYAPALVLKRVRPSLPLWVLFVAVQAVDVGWGVFILTGVERARIVPGFTESNALDLYFMPYTHSLAATLIWAVAAALAWRALAPGAKWLEALVIGAAVASHFALDLLVHVRDLPLASDAGVKWGLGLWRHRELALAVEGGLFVAAAAWNLAGAEPRRRRRLAILFGAMTVFLIASFYLPTPPTPALMAASGLATYALLAGAAAWNEKP